MMANEDTHAAPPPQPFPYYTSFTFNKTGLTDLYWSDKVHHTSLIRPKYIFEDKPTLGSHFDITLMPDVNTYQIS